MLAPSMLASITDLVANVSATPEEKLPKLRASIDATGTVLLSAGISMMVGSLILSVLVAVHSLSLWGEGWGEGLHAENHLIPSSPALLPAGEGF